MARLEPGLWLEPFGQVTNDKYLGFFFELQREDGLTSVNSGQRASGVYMRSMWTTHLSRFVGELSDNHRVGQDLRRPGKTLLLPCSPGLSEAS